MSILIKDTNTEDLQRAILMFSKHKIVELTNHGDLVDRDIVWRDMVQTESFQEAQIALWYAPVVIPAERNEE